MDIKPKKKRYSLKVLSLFVAQVVKHPVLFSIVLVGLTAIQVTELVIPLYFKQLVNILAQNSPSPEVIETLLGIVVLIGLWWCIRWAANRTEHFSNVFLEPRAMADLLISGFSYLIGHSHNFFISRFAGSLTHKVSKYAKAFQHMYDIVVLQFFTTFVFLCGATGVLFFHNQTLGTILFLWIVLFVSFQLFATHLRQNLRVKRAELETRVTGAVADSISNHDTAILFSGGHEERKIVDSVVEQWYRASVKSWFTDALLWAILGAFIIGIEIVMLYVGINFWKEGLLTVGDFIVIQSYLLAMFVKLDNLTIELRRFYDAFADASEMAEILETPQEVIDVKHAKEIKVSKGEISFKGIGFKFNQNREILKNFSLIVAGGERVALVGPSGAGKSTITKLLLRLYNIEKGSIEIDGQNIASVTQDSLREVIAFVPQEPVLFHRTLMENIRYGRRDASDAEVIQAAKEAHCHEFIDDLPQGYSTLVGERGIKLSGGERQRVAIARAILKDAPILVLDEATSSLDSESETLIQEALAILMQHKTVVVIAHRLSTIMRMDRIVVVEKGEIVSEGTHAELLARGGLYKKLWSIQAGGFIVDEEEVLAEEQKLS
ncbi:MAG: ABC transporter ATP-binding protein [Patescibacteria group bacterium]